MKVLATIFRRPLLVGLLVFIIFLFLTQYLTYQRYLLRKNAEQKEVTSVANAAKERMQATLNYSFATSKILAFVVERFGEPRNFDSLAYSLLRSNKFIDAVQLTRKGTIIQIYPLKGNESVIGYDILADSNRNREALKAIKKKELFFSGPFELKQGGLGVVGRQPVFINDEFWGFAAVVIRLPTLLREAGISNNESSDFAFELSKINPNTQQEEFFLKYPATFNKNSYLVVDVPDGEWKLYVQRKNTTSIRDVLPFGLLGVILSILGGIFAWYLTRQPQKLSQLVKDKTEKLTTSEKNFRVLLESITDAFVALDRSWCYTYMNRKAGQIFNRDPEKMIGKHIWTEFPEGEGRPFHKAYEKAMNEGRYIYLEEHYEPYNLWFENHIYPSDNGIAVFFRDITGRKKNEEKILKMSRLYDFSRQVNQVIIDVTNEPSLFKSICDVAVSVGNFRMAWIGMVNEELHTVDPVSFSGEERGYLVQIKKITTENIREGKGPTGTALREGITVVCNDIETDLNMIPWKTEAMERGYKSSISLPVSKLGRVVGSLSLYASEKDFFDQEEVEMLERIAANISFSLDNYEKEKLRRQAEIGLKTNEIFIRSLINASPDIIYIYDLEESKNVYINEGMQKMLGYSENETRNMGENLIAQLMHPDDFSIYLKQTFPQYKQLPDDQLLVHEFRMRDKAGKWHWLLAKESIYQRKTDNTPKQIFGVVTDITERKKIEQEIFHANEMLEQAEEHAGLGSWEYDVLKQQGRWSKQMFRLFGLPLRATPPDFENFLGLIHPDDRHLVKAALDDMVAGRNPVVHLFRTNPELTELKYLMPSWYAEKDNSGRTIRFSGTAYDITRQYLAERQIIGEKEISDTIINSLPGVFYLYNRQGKFYRWNKNFETVLGYSATEIEKLHPLDFFDNPDKELLTEKINNVFLNGEDSVEADFLLKSGEKIPYYFTGRSIDYHGELCLMGVGIDISERVAAQQLLQDTAYELSVSEKKYRLLFESNPLPLWIYSLKDFRFIDVNNAAIEHYGYSKAEFLSMTLMDIRPPEDIPLLLEWLKSDDISARNEKKIWRHYKKDRSLIQVEIRSYDTVFNNEPVRLTLVMDVTEKLMLDKKIHESLESVRMLTAHIQNIREEERKRIGREIHDELGQQLTAIKMDVAWIDKKTPAEADQVKMKLKNIISLLDSSNLSIRKILNELRMGILEHQSIEEALQWQGQQFTDNTGIPIELNCPGSIVKLDEMVATCLFRVFQESLTNITRYAKAKKVIAWLTQDQNFINLSIEDDGIGFDPSQLKTTKSFGILGMKERVASLNGMFELITTPGKGTRIEIKIPLNHA